MGNACCADEAKRGDTNDFRVAGNAKLEDGGRTRKKAAMNGFGMEDQYGTEGGESGMRSKLESTEKINPEAHKPMTNVAQTVLNHNQLNAEVEKRLREVGTQQYTALPMNKNLPKLGPYKYQTTGETFEGQYNKGKREGFGKSVMADGTLYEGSWQNDMKHGQGRIIHTDGSMFIGSWLNDKPHGQGKLVYKDGNGYTGEWMSGDITGYGSQTWPDGTKYEGEFKKGLKHGQGVFTWPDGNRYEGQYKDDTRDGYGTFNWNTGQVYEGYWMAGMQHGNGKMINPQGQAKSGKWEKGKNVQWFDAGASTGGNKH